MRIAGWLLTVIGALVAGPIIIGWILPEETQKAIYGKPSVYLLSGYIVLFLLIGAGMIIWEEIRTQK